MKEEKQQPTYRITVEFTDDAEPVTTSGIPQDDLVGFYSIIGDPGARARVQRDDGVQVMFPGKYIRFIFATPEVAK
jgi:hypothetical protein